MNKTLERNENGTVIMNLRNLKIICDRKDLYQIPENNETLYLHYLGFDKIENLEPYKNLIALWLNNNAIGKIENLDELTQLVSLYLNHNLIQKIENLSLLSNLCILNLSHNSIKKIENLQALNKLQNLNISNNHLTGYESLEGLLECLSITNLDISNNFISYEQSIVELFGKTNLACLYLKANSFVRECSDYRKTMIVTIKNLKYLDDKPVTEGERKISEAWQIGGKAAEQQERLAQIEKRKEINYQNYLQTLERQQRGEMRSNLLIQKENILREIDLLQMLLVDGDDVQNQIEQKEKELQNIEIELEKYKIDQLSPYKCMLTTKDEYGNIIILNKSEDELKQIKQKYFNEDIQQLNETDLPDLENENQTESINENLEDKNNINLDQQYNKNEFQEDKKIKILREFKDKKNGWTTDNEELLQNLLIFHSFDYQIVSKEVKQKMAEQNSQLQYLDPEDLKLIWTYIELTKQKNQKPQNLDGID
ncbi:unnamed protein product [Paramecium primaurelia]|uniref:Uncharacterized protein n=1 Tax=Paramecium primaurelia TaxID=5886 RepID=A0A8S1KIN3_PARPR|nr:unnamed protein product [Paramecium primaurelia]